MNSTRAHTQIGDVANFARAILANYGKLACAHRWLLAMSCIRMCVIWANSRLRIRDYWPCREFARTWFGLTRACMWATVDNVANSHALDLSKLCMRIHNLAMLLNSSDYWPCDKFACAWFGLVLLMTEKYPSRDDMYSSQLQPSETWDASRNSSLVFEANIFVFITQSKAKCWMLLNWSTAV